MQESDGLQEGNVRKRKNTPTSQESATPNEEEIDRLQKLPDEIDRFGDDYWLRRHKRPVDDDIAQGARRIAVEVLSLGLHINTDVLARLSQKMPWEPQGGRESIAA